MPSSPERHAIRTAKRSRYGWGIIFIATLAIFFSGPGQTYSVSTFIDPIIQNFEWSRSLVSGLYSGATLLAGFIMLVVGRLVDQFGTRRMMTAVSVLFALSCLFMSAVGSLVTLFVGFTLIRVLGQGSLTLIPNTLVPQWFIRRRGRALGIVALGVAASSAILPYLNLVMIDAVDWRFAWKVWAVVLAVFLAPLAWLMTRDRPEDVGLLPDGALPTPEAPETLDCAVGGSTASAEGSREAPASARGGTSVATPTTEWDWTPQQAMRTGTFWTLLLTASIPAMVNTGLTFHHVSIILGNDLSAATAALIFTAMAITQVPVSLMAGYACDRWPVKNVLAIGLILMAASAIVMLWTTSVAMAVVAGVLRGVTMGISGIVNGVVWPHYYGRRHLGSLRGTATTAMVIGSALGPLPFGAFYDWTGGYTQVIVLMTAVALAGAVAAYLVGKPKSPDGVTAGGAQRAISAGTQPHRGSHGQS